MQKKYVIAIGIGGVILVAGIAAVVYSRRTPPPIPPVTVGGTVHTDVNVPAPATP